MAKENPKFDFDYIAQALGLMPLPGDGSAIRGTAISSLDFSDESGLWEFTLDNGEGFELTGEDMLEFEKYLRDLVEKQKAARLEALRAEMRLQFQARLDVEREFTGSVSPGGILVAPRPRS